MSAIQRLPTVYLSVVETRIVFRLSPGLSSDELSTFMIACPASFTNASRSFDACFAPTKL